MSIYAALFASLMAAGAAIAIPIGPVPIVLQNLFVLLAGLLLGGKWGAASVGIYLLAGALGMPVFSGGTGGIGRFAGPTGGYLIGFLPAVYIVGKTVEKLGDRSMVLVLAMMISILPGMRFPRAVNPWTATPWPAVCMPCTTVAPVILKNIRIA